MISVIVPYWNSEPWLDRCCQSLQKQTGDFEFIFVDDHSTDNGADIVAKYAEMDERFLPLKNEHKKGVSGARNTGILYASGEWTTFLDADDEYLDNAEATFRSVLKTEANIYQFNHRRWYSARGYVTKYANKAGLYETAGLPDCWWGIWNKLFRTEFIKGIRFDESLSYGEDGLFVLECLAIDGYIRHADFDKIVVVHRFENKGSLSHIKKANDIRKQIHAYEKFGFRQSNSNNKDLQRVICRQLSELWLRVLKGI